MSVVSSVGGGFHVAIVGIRSHKPSGPGLAFFVHVCSGRSRIRVDVQVASAFAS